MCIERQTSTKKHNFIIKKKKSSSGRYLAKIKTDPDDSDDQALLKTKAAQSASQ